MKNTFSKVLTIGFSVLQTLTLIGFLVQRNFFFASETAAILVCYLAAVYILKRKKLLLENYIHTLVVLSLAGHSIIGEYINSYNMVIHYDKLLHFFGTYSFSLAAYTIIMQTLNLEIKSRMYVFILISSLGISLGALFEMLEFTGDIILKTASQGGAVDTNVDMIADTVGALVAALVIAFRKYRLKKLPQGS